MGGEKGMEVRYCICKHCGNIVEKVKDKGVPVICCGEPMQELKTGVTDAAVEKHVPVYTVEGSHVHVVVGETKHPMLEEHFIEWITLNTNQGIYRKQLNPGQEPVADFCLCDGEYDEEEGYPEGGIAPGTKWEDVPEDFECPLCNVGKDQFLEVE